MLRIVLAAVLSGMIGSAATAAALETPEQVFAAALRQSIGGPARADLGDQATERLDEGFLIVPKEPGARLLAVSHLEVPADFIGLLLGSEGMQSPGILRFVPAGAIDADAALAWTADDFLASLQETVERGNPVRVQAGLEEREVRRWIAAPRYHSERHQIYWCALVLPKGAPRDLDGELTFHAVGFGRDGYVALTVLTSVQKASEIEHMAALFLAGLNFRPGKAYGDIQPTDRRAPGALAGAMEVAQLHKANSATNFWSSDSVIPVAGGVVAAIGALALVLHLQRAMRREARRG